MKLKLKKFALWAGRPVAFLHEEDAKKLNVHIGDRVEISSNGKKLVAIVDVVKGALHSGEIYLSNEITSLLKLSIGKCINVELSLEPPSSRFIAKKLAGKKLSKEEIFSIIRDIVNNSLTEAELAYFVSGVYKNGMTIDETINLTEAIYKSGEILDWDSKTIVDKHSIGGLAGNRTTPIVVSICAAAGIIMPKTSSRAITSAAGTADVMETITKVDFPASELKQIVNKAGACLVWGGSLGLAPADDKLIRVERLLGLDPESQLIASILAKKLAMGSKYVLIDIPFGKNAKVSKKHALRLKNLFIKIGSHFGLKIHVVLTDGSEPIGNGIGPVLEMIDVLKVLKKESPPKDLEKKSVFLASQIFEMTGKAKKGLGLQMAQEILDSGKAFEKFEEIISAQGRKSVILKPADFVHAIKASKSGKIKSINNKLINYLGKILGCPQDKSSGIYIYKHCNERIEKNEPLLTLYAESRKKLKDAVKFFNSSKVIEIS